MAQSEEEESTLFMVSASVLSVFPNFDSKSTKVIDGGASLVSVVGEGSIDPEEELQLGIAKTSVGELIQLKEERVFTQIGERGEHQRWVLDTEITNHMTRAKSAFQGRLGNSRDDKVQGRLHRRDRRAQHHPVRRQGW